MNASEANKIAKDFLKINQELKSVLSDIESISKCGFFSERRSYLNKNTIESLKQMGYKVVELDENVKKYLGYTYTISWENA